MGAHDTRIGDGCSCRCCVLSCQGLGSRACSLVGTGPIVIQAGVLFIPSGVCLGATQPPLDGAGGSWLRARLPPGLWPQGRERREVWTDVLIPLSSPQFEVGPFGCILLTLSAILSRSTER